MNGSHSDENGVAGVNDVDSAGEVLREILKEVVDHIDRGKASGSLLSSEADHSLPPLAVHGIHTPIELRKRLDLNVGADGISQEAFMNSVRDVLENSVNTWHQGFMGKLYASTSAVGLASEMVLSAINSNAHVYNGAPVLAIVEKYVTEQLAGLFGFDSPYAGGIAQPGGSASNSSSIIIARNTLFPEMKEDGLAGRKLVIFTSEHGHYSSEKAAQMHGFGSKAVRSVAVDSRGQMIPEELQRLVEDAIQKGEEPFYVNCTAGTTVLGSFDPIHPLADICKKYRMWMHVDGAWGGAVVFSDKLRKGRIDGIERADSIAFNPHKLLGVPLTCSFLLGKDMRQFWKAMTLPAGYLFHDEHGEEPDPRQMYDLADLTPQCGRRGDALKMYLVWRYYGSDALGRSVEQAFATAAYMADLVVNGTQSRYFQLATPLPLPNTQVCFYFVKDADHNAFRSLSVKDISAQTMVIYKALMHRGLLIDIAPGPRGKMLRVVVSIQTHRATVERLVREVVDIGSMLA